MYTNINPVELHLMLQKAIDAKKSGNDRLSKLLAHQINCLTDDSDAYSIQQLLQRLGLAE